MTTTQFKVTNNTKGQLNNQFILVFLTPINESQNWLYAAWQQLNPGEGGSQFFTLNQDISGKMIMPNQFETNTMTIAPGYVSLYENSTASPQGQLGNPIVGSSPIVQPPTVTVQQAGIKNMTSAPAQAPYAQWLVNGNLTVQSIAPVSAGGTLSAFELDTKLYWAIGNRQVGANFKLNQVTSNTVYNLPAGTTQVDVNLTYANNQFQFAFSGS